MPQTVLLIEDNSPTAALVKQAILGSDDGTLIVERVRRCSEAQERLNVDRARSIAAIVTNLFLPDSQGLQTIARLLEVSPHIPILVVTTADNEPIAKQAIQRGAQDYVLQHRLDNYLLPKVVQNMLYRAANVQALLVENERSRVALKSIDDAVFDYLTGLPNRLLLGDRLAQSIASARRLGETLAVLWLDVDRFKHVNYALGNEIGDHLLRSIAERLVQAVRGSDTVSRQGGDAFLVVLSGLSHVEDAALSAQKILESIRIPHRIESHQLQVTATIGIATYPDDGDDAESLVKNAGIALSNAQQEGPNSYGFFKPHVNELVIERRFLESGLRHALERQEFVLHYEPQIDLRSEAVVGAVALVRWCRPKRGMSFPPEFMPPAERSGCVLQIGRWALRKACSEARSWRDAGLAALPIALEVSGTELRAAGFADNVAAILRETHFEPQCLQLAVSELALMHDCIPIASALDALKNLGVQLMLDDFGTGTSSLTHLTRFPFDALRIDESLIRGMGTCDHDLAMVNTVISAATSFQLRVIAQGIDTRKQCLTLQRLQCHEGQGRYFREPVTGDEFAQLLQDGCSTLEGA